MSAVATGTVGRRTPIKILVQAPPVAGRREPDNREPPTMEGSRVKYRILCFSLRLNSSKSTSPTLNTTLSFVLTYRRAAPPSRRAPSSPHYTHLQSHRVRGHFDLRPIRAGLPLSLASRSTFTLPRYRNDRDGPGPNTSLGDSVSCRPLPPPLVQDRQSPKFISSRTL